MDSLFAGWDCMLACDREKERIAVYVSRKGNTILVTIIVLLVINAIGEFWNDLLPDVSF